jgi:hypothetical protein
MMVKKTVVTRATALAVCGVLGMAPAAAQARWTQQHPASHPPARAHAAMAYDTATRTVVLFGAGGYRDADTWVWNGSTWTQRAQKSHPRGRCCAAMAYDTATRTAVLFGGFTINDRNAAGTWTWG